MESALVLRSGRRVKPSPRKRLSKTPSGSIRIVKRVGKVSVRSRTAVAKGRAVGSRITSLGSADGQSRITGTKFKYGGDDIFEGDGSHRVVLDPGKHVSGAEDTTVDYWDPIPPGTAAGNIWQIVLIPTMEYLSTSGIKWNALHLGMRNGQETVLIIYEKGEGWDEESLTDGLRARFFPLEAFPGIQFAEAKVRKGAALGAGDYQVSQNCGVGIGVGGVCWSAGTVGGYLRSEDGGLYGLSCHHVLLPTRLSGPEFGDENKGTCTGIDYPDFLDEVGTHHGAFHPGDARIDIMQPACRDHLKTINALQIFTKDCENKLGAMVEKATLMGIELPPERTSRLEIVIAQSNTRLDDLQKFDRYFGILKATSGYMVDPENLHSLDWGIFKLVENRTGGNDLPPVPSVRTTGPWGFLEAGSWVDGNIADPVEGEEVFKVGKSSGSTFGIVNGVHDGVNLEENKKKSIEWKLGD
ncbi:hypothetical protein DRE_04260 [Drechslerella stenobrocha 248]|uniref:Uncharacterized protein n=1 Tax=Drechslerella stenobrocha 248 TaxID=1043628 RepID=W7I2F0_9PEZI|nr:hypothetical protein DRE_04260 [Drechslerella stenobrocha 248]